jgi:hypothetical protein
LLKTNGFTCFFQQESTAPVPSTPSLNPTSIPDDVVDIKDVELTLLPSYLQEDANKQTSKEETSPQQQPPSVPRRPPRNGSTNVEGKNK